MPAERADRPVRVTFVLHKFSCGGSDRVAAYLARGFTDLGMDVDMVVFSKGGEVEDLLVELAGEDIPVTYLGRASRWRSLDLVRGLLPLSRHFRRRMPDAIVSTANNTALATIISAILAGLRGTRIALKTTNPIASSRHRGIARTLRLWSYRVIFRRADAVWTLSADESAEMRAEFPAFTGLFHDVANPYVTERMLAPPEPADETSGTTVVSVARLTEQKRLDRMIAGFAHVRTPGARLIILGEGEDRDVLTRQIARLGLEQRVSLAGYVADVAAVLHRADLSILTSDYEGFPAALLESMAADCPVISTDCFPAARTLLGAIDGGAIIKDVEPKALGALIDRMLARPRPSGLRAIAKRYSIANGVASHLTALNNLLEAGTR